MPERRLPSATRESARVAGWLVGLEAAAAGVGALLAQHRAGSVAVQAFVAEWGAGRLGVAWSDPAASPPTLRRISGRLGVGVALGTGAGLATLALAAATGAVRFAEPRFAGSELLLGLVVVALVAMRDELLLRGLVLRAFGRTLSPPLQIAACALVAAGAKLGQIDGPPLLALTHVAGLASLLVAALAGASFATLWLRERGAFVAWGAHLAWSLVTTTAIAGGVTDGRWAATAWGGGGVYDQSLAVVTGLGLVTAASVWTWVRATARTR